MAAAAACCTCATLLSALASATPDSTTAVTAAVSTTPEAELSDEKNEKRDSGCAAPERAGTRSLECCGRVICGRCIAKNERFASYCPFCQLSSPTSKTPLTPMRHPHSSSSSAEELIAPPPPPYAAAAPVPPMPRPGTAADPAGPPAYASTAPDVVHHLDHARDTLPGLSLRYGVPADVLRRRNRLGGGADHLLRARKTLVIPGAYYTGGVSLSPAPVGGEEEDERKTKVFRFQRACRVAEYDVALLYLRQADYDLEKAMERYRDDERWEREHPLQVTAKGKGTKHDVGRRRFFGR